MSIDSEQNEIFPKDSELNAWEFRDNFQNQRSTQYRDIVLMSSENGKKIEWLLTKFIELYPSKSSQN